jgi:hypothetical protein
VAENIRTPDQDVLVERRRAEIQAEAMRQHESCLYTSTMLYMWLRWVRWQHKATVVLPLVLTALAGFSYVKDWVPAGAVALMAFFATLIPTIANALDIETHVDELKRVAAEYKSLQDRFRQLARIGAFSDVNDAEARLTALMDKLDVARSGSISPPEKYFEKAQNKIKAGHYDFSVDVTLRDAAASGLVEPLPKLD